VDDILARYPEHSDELRPILQGAQFARKMSPAGPSHSAMLKGRTKVLQHAARLREKRTVSRRMPVIPLFQRFALTFSILLMLLGSGTGLVSASSGALPGDNLYSVKRTWEDLRLALVKDLSQRVVLENEFEQTRLHEAGELLSLGREAEITIAGLVSEQGGAFMISGLPVLVTADTQGALVSGDLVMASGQTAQNGEIVLYTIEVLPPGSMVPLGIQVKDDLDREHNGFHLSGFISSMSDTFVVVNGNMIYLQSTEIKGNIFIGQLVDVEGYYSDDGSFIAVEIEVEHEGGDEEDTNSGTSSSDDQADVEDISSENDNNSLINGDNSGDPSGENDPCAISTVDPFNTTSGSQNLCGDSSQDNTSESDSGSSSGEDSGSDDKDNSGSNDNSSDD
jgi:hypothetical protein